MPRVDNPVVHLAAAVAKLGGYQPPMRLNETTRMYFQRLASISSPEDAFLYQHLEDPAVQEKLRTAHLSQNSNLRTSISPTIIKGGFRSNVIPGDAEATLDIRALPDEDMSEFLASLRRVINDPAHRSPLLTGRIIPLLVRRGGCAVNKKSRSHLIPRRRGGRSQTAFQNAFRSLSF